MWVVYTCIVLVPGSSPPVANIVSGWNHSDTASTGDIKAIHVYMWVVRANLFHLEDVALVLLCCLSTDNAVPTGSWLVTHCDQLIVRYNGVKSYIGTGIKLDWHPSPMRIFHPVENFDDIMCPSHHWWKVGCYWLNFICYIAISWRGIED